MEQILTLAVIVAIIIGLVLIVKKIKGAEAEEVKLPYRLIGYFFTRSEQMFFDILSEKIDKKYYTIFPKVRLADFVQVTASKEEYTPWWNKIRSKHIDFLIWDNVQRKIKLAIELDGKSHESEKGQVRDAFVEKVYSSIGVELVRVKVGSDFNASIQNINSKLAGDSGSLSK